MGKIFNYKPIRAYIHVLCIIYILSIFPAFYMIQSRRDVILMLTKCSFDFGLAL